MEDRLDLDKYVKKKSGMPAASLARERLTGRCGAWTDLFRMLRKYEFRLRKEKRIRRAKFRDGRFCEEKASGKPKLPFRAKTSRERSSPQPVY